MTSGTRLISKLKLIGESLSGDLNTLSGYESYFNEGDTGELRLYLNNELSQERIDTLEREICNQGVMLTAPIIQDARILVIKFQKAIAPLLIIGGAIVVIIGSVIGWQVFRSTQLGVPIWVWILGGVTIGYIILRRKKWLGKQ